MTRYYTTYIMRQSHTVICEGLQILTTTCGLVICNDNFVKLCNFDSLIDGWGPSLIGCGDRPESSPWFRALVLVLLTLGEGLLPLKLQMPDLLNLPEAVFTCVLLLVFIYSSVILYNLLYILCLFIVICLCMILLSPIMEVFNKDIIIIIVLSLLNDMHMETIRV